MGRKGSSPKTSPSDSSAQPNHPSTTLRGACADTRARVPCPPRAAKGQALPQSVQATSHCPCPFLQLQDKALLQLVALQGALCYCLSSTVGLTHRKCAPGQCRCSDSGVNRGVGKKRTERGTERHIQRHTKRGTGTDEEKRGAVCGELRSSQSGKARAASLQGAVSTYCSRQSLPNVILQTSCRASIACAAREGREEKGAP